MAYIRPQPKQRISKEERKQLLQEYYLHYKELIHDQGIEALKRMSGIHLAIPVFSKGYRPKQGKVAP